MSIQILISIKGHNSVDNKPTMSSGLYVDGRQKYSKFDHNPSISVKNDFYNNQGWKSWKSIESFKQFFATFMDGWMS